MQVLKRKICTAVFMLASCGSLYAAATNLLFAQTWSLLIINNQSLRLDRFPNTKPNIQFKEDNTYSAYMGCNQISGTFKLAAENGIEFGASSVSTKMACDKYYMDLENEFIATLPNVKFYAFQEEKVLTFLDGDKRPRAILSNVLLY